MQPIARELARGSSPGAAERILIRRFHALDWRGALRDFIPWVATGGLAILDQGLFAGTNFLINVLVARWLTLAEYGAFALAYSIFLLFSTFHTAIFTEPMMVFGSGKYEGQFKKYLGILVRGHLGLMLPAGTALLGAGLVVGRLYSPMVEKTFLGLGVAAPFILLLWLVRRAFYLRIQPGWSAVGGVIYLVFFLAIVEVLKAGNRLTPATAFLAMAGAALLVVIFLLVRLELHRGAPHGNLTPTMVAIEHWRYGRWSVAGAAVQSIPGNIYFLVLPALIGLEGTGALKVVLNLVMPAIQASGALSLLLLPNLVRDRQRAGGKEMARSMKLYLLLFLCGSSVYLALLWRFCPVLFRLIYAGKYREYSSIPVLVAGLLPFGSSVAMVLGSALRALERPDRLFWCYVGSSIVAIGAGVPLAAAHGVTGALVGLLLSSMANGLLMLVFYKSAARPASATQALPTG